MDDKSADIASSTDDTGLRCLECEYNLSGLLSERCPECGCLVDWELVRQRAEDALPLPASTFDRWPGLWKVPAFFITTAEVMFMPWRFASRLPPNPKLGAAYLYAFVCVAVGIGGYYATTGNVEIGLLVGWFVGVWVCVELEAVVLALFLPATGCRRRYRFWRVAAMYTTCFLAFQCLSGPPVFWGPDIFPGAFMNNLGHQGHPVPFGSPFPSVFPWSGYLVRLLFYWWWAVLWIMVLTRAKNMGVAVAAFFLPPILLVVASGAGCIAGGGVGGLWGPLMM